MPAQAVIYLDGVFGEPKGSTWPSQRAGSARSEAPRSLIIMAVALIFIWAGGGVGNGVSIDQRQRRWLDLARGWSNEHNHDPTIFSLGVERLGERIPQASGLLCMVIVGGALIPLLSGVVADNHSLATALVVPAACFLLIASYGWIARHPAKAPIVDPAEIV